MDNSEPHRSSAEQWLLRAELNEAAEVHRVLAPVRIGLALPWPRKVIAACCFEICIEHAHAVAQLFETRHDGSGMALVRLVFEAFIRGVWIGSCASESQVARLETDTLRFPTMRALIADIETRDLGFRERTMSALHADSWEAMNSYTHTGMLQISRRIRGDEMAPDYETGAIVEALRTCAAFALLAAQHTCLTAGREDRALLLVQTMQALHQRAAARQAEFEGIRGSSESS